MSDHRDPDAGPIIGMVLTALALVLLLMA